MRKSLMMMLVGLPLVAVAGPGVWTSGGPYGGIVYDLQFDPATPTTIYASAGDGFFKTINRGASWARAQSGLVGRLYGQNFVIDADAPQTLYAFDSTNRLYRSSDGAQNWSLTGYAAPADTFITSITDVPGISGQIFISLAVLTDSAGVPLPVTGTLVLRSNDAGASFVAAGTGLPSGLGFAQVRVDPTDASRILAGTQTAFFPAPPATVYALVFRSSDAGLTWTPVLTDPGITSVQPGMTALSFGAGSTVYGLDYHRQVYRSDDDGATWTLRSGFASTSILVAHPTVAMEVWLGANQSIDGGDNFTAQATDLTANPSYLDSLGNQVPAQVNQLAFEPGYPAAGTFLWAATGGAGVMRRSAAASNWSAPNINGNLGASSIRSIAINPNSSSISGGRAQLLFAGFTDGQDGSTPGLYQSVDGASSWFPFNDGLQATALRTLTIDPLSVGTTPVEVANSIIYAGGRNSLSSISARNGSLYRSRNNGVTWTRLEGNLPTRTSGTFTFVQIGTVRDTELDPRSCVLPIIDPTGPVCAADTLHRLYATSNGATTTPASSPLFPYRVMRSDDADTTVINPMTGRPDVHWVALDATLPAPIQDAARFQAVIPVNIVIDPNNSNRLYIGTFSNFFDHDPLDGIPLTDMANGVFRSTDAGANWVQASGGLPRLSGFTNAAYSVLALAIHPTNGDILWASVVNNDLNPTSGSIYKTIDGGNTWFESATGIASRIDIRDLLVDPIAPDILYASGSGTAANPGSIYRSDDGGANWRSISIGLPVGAAAVLALDPFNATILHAGTTSGVWSLEQLPDADGDGIPDSVEGSINGGDGNGDGSPDSLQGDVGSTGVSFRSPNGLDSPSEVGNVTADIDVAASSGGSCDQSVDVQGKVAARNGRDFIGGTTRFYTYPQDLIRFDIQNCDQAFIDITYHATLLNFNQYGWSFRFYGPSTPGDDSTVGWHDFSSRAVRTGAKKWRIGLQSGQLGSYRPASSHTLLFEGGPACHDDRLLQAGFEDGQVLTPPTCN